MRGKVIIIGGGVIGLASAFECARRDYDVVVLEKGTCGGQASGAAAGMLAPFSEVGEDPDDFFRLCHESLKWYPEWQAEVKQQSGIEFEYNTSGSLHPVFHEADTLALETTIDWQKKFGVKVELLEGGELHEMEPGITEKVTKAIYYPEEHHLYSPDYVKALEAACRRAGVVIYERSEVIKTVPGEGDVSVETEDGESFTGDYLVVCSGAWAKQWENSFDLTIPLFPIRGQICAYRLPPDTVSRIVFTSQGYFVQKADGTLVCGASEDIAGFDTSVTEKGVARLESWSKTVFPFLKDKTPDHRWAGLRPATRDGFPLLGKLRNHPNVIFATGHYRNGILLSPVTAKTVGTLIDGHSPEVAIDSFDPERFG
jgi:glycine oxidase